MSYSPGSFSTEHINVGPMHNLPDGFPFDSNSHIRRLAEPASFALFPYIAGVAIMDDRIAAAVDAHSSFREQPWGHLLKTIDAATVLVFGSDEETIETAERMYSLHNTIKGTNEGVHYDANNIDAQTWVLAALFDGIKQTRQRWAPPELSKEQEEGLFQNIKTFGQFFGIDPTLQPDKSDELKRYWDGRIDEQGLLKTNVSRRMAQTVFRFTSPKVPRLLERVGQAITITSLDPRLQKQAELTPTLSDVKIAAAVDKIMQNTYGRLPSAVREQAIPAYVGARRRSVAALGKLSSLRAINA